MADKERDNAGVIAPPPLIYLIPLLLGLLLNRRFSAPLLPRKAALTVGWPLVGGGAMLMAWFYLTMKRAGTTVHPDESTSKVVTDGPFRHTRNPAYLSMAMMYAGISTLKNTLWPMLLLPAALTTIHRGVIEREEHYLERKFGEEYLLYKEQVRRWV